MKRLTSSAILIPVRFASFFSLAIWESERNMETRFMPCIYVEHISLSRGKRTHSENKFAEVECVLLATRKIVREFTMHFHRIFSGVSAHRFAVSDRAAHRDHYDPRGRQGTPGGQRESVWVREFLGNLEFTFRGQI